MVSVSSIESIESLCFGINIVSVPSISQALIISEEASDEEVAPSPTDLSLLWLLVLVQTAPKPQEEQQS